MADNTKEKPLDSPADTQSENSSDEIIPNNEIEAINLNQEIENMEVHHHSHVAHGKKNWKSYFWEFLMLFLAVFCGFLAENWREHYVEHQREKQYARQLVADLRADSLQFARLYVEMRRVIGQQDAFINLMSSATISTDKEIITGIAPLQWIYKVSKTSSTYDQMKASGSLRYIRNPTLTNSIQRYYEIMLPYFESIADQSMRIYTSYFEPFSLDHFRKGDIDINSDTLINKDPIYRNRTGESDFKLRNIIVIYREYLSISLERFLVDDIKKVNELISTLKTEYRLE